LALIKVQGLAEQGGQFVVTSGVNSSSYSLDSFPLCTVTVYAAGTTSLSSIYSDSSSTPKANPFTASANAEWYFYVASGAHYDIKFSGAGIDTPFTISDIVVSDPAGSGGGGSASVTDVTASPYNADKTGATSPYTGIAAAITAAVAAGTKRVYMPAGTYRFVQADFTAHTNLIDLLTSDNVELFGDGIGKTVIVMPTTIVKGASGNRIVGGLGSNCWVHDLTIVGPDLTNNVFNSSGLIAIAGGGGPNTDNRIERIEVTNFNDNNTTAGAESVGVGDGGLQVIVSTTLGTVITAGERTVTPASMVGINSGAALRIGGTTEDIIVTSTTTTTFTATFAQNHGASDSVTGYDEGFSRVKVIDCYFHDSRYATAVDFTSNGNSLIGCRIINIGNGGTQHGIYMSGGDNYVGYNEFRGLSGFAFHQYQANGNMDMAGNRYDHNLIVGGIGATIINGTANGNNPRMPSGVSIQRYTTFTGNVWIDASLTSEVPIILKGNNWWFDVGKTGSVQFPFNSNVGLDNFVNGRVLGNSYINSSAPIQGASLSLGTAIIDTGQQPNFLSLQAESGWAGAPNNGYGSSTGGHLYLLPGNGRRLFRVVSNLLGAVAVTITTSPIQAASPLTTTYTSGVDFILGSDDTPAQLAVTATNLALAIDDGRFAGLGKIVAAKPTGADVWIIPQAGRAVTISSNQAARIEAISGTDGDVYSLVGNGVVTKVLWRGEGAVLSISSNAVAPTNEIHHCGAGLIKNITVPAGFTGGTVTLIPDAAFTYDATGNIVVPAAGGTATVDRAMTFSYSSSSAKWIPSY